MFPELSERVKGFMSQFEGTPSLGLKTFVGPYPALGSYEEVFTDYYARHGFSKLQEASAGYSPTWSGEMVNASTALNHSVVFACNRIISESCAFLPLALMQNTGTGKRPATDHPMYSALHDAPNDEMTAMEFRETRTSNTVLGGNGYSQIVRRSGTGMAIGLNPLTPGQVDIDRDKSGRLVYLVRDSGAVAKTYTVQPGKAQDILHLRGIGSDGIRGYSVLTKARQSIGTGLAAEKNLGQFFANGGRLPYHLEMVNRFKTPEDFEAFRAQWEKTYRVAHRAPILENDIKLVQDGLSMADAQMLETRQFTVLDLCRWFNVSPHMVADLSRATFSNIEQLALEFVKFTLGAWLTRWEQALWRCVLTPEEKTQGYYFKHNVNALLRGDFASRITGYAQMLSSGIANQNEVRALEDLNPYEGGEFYHLQGAMGKLMPDGQIQISSAPKPDAAAQPEVAPKGKTT